MENNILKEIVINSKATLKLSHLGLKWGMYSFLVPLVLVVLLPAVFLPVIGLDFLFINSLHDVFECQKRSNTIQGEKLQIPKDFYHKR